MKSDRGKLGEAKLILAALGMPKTQQNPNAVYTFLAFADEKYGKTYAENTRETIRRQAIHQFVQGGILTRNPDEPGLATNSPRTHYALTAEALEVARAFGTPDFDSAAARFRAAQGGGLAERYAKPRRSAEVVLTLPDGASITLSPGAHNRLHARIIEAFLPRFAPGARVLYLGDTDHKSKLVDAPRLRALGVPVTKHDKLPDLVLHDEHRNWLFLIEAVTSHGPVSPKRQMELQQALASSTAGRVYVSAFPSFREFKKYAADIAWETEVWVAEFPDHLLHYNGDRFFGPRS